MGYCFSKLDSIENAKSVDDILYIIKQDKAMFIAHLNIVVCDKILPENLKQAKINYFMKILPKFDEYFDYLKAYQNISVST